MRFQYSLDTVLRVRVLREEREERRLLEIFQEIERARQAIERISAEIADSANRRTGRQSALTPGHKLRLESRAAQDLWECRQELRMGLENLEQLRDKQIALYQSARRDREMLVELRSKQKLAFDTSLLVQEQRMMDDNFNARRHRN